MLPAIVFSSFKIPAREASGADKPLTLKSELERGGRGEVKQRIPPYQYFESVKKFIWVFLEHFMKNPNELFDQPNIDLYSVLQHYHSSRLCPGIDPMHKYKRFHTSNFNVFKDYFSHHSSPGLRQVV